MIFVKLQDNNDNAPIFSARSYNVSVEECLPVHTAVARVHATDRDGGRNGQVIYSIVGGGNGAAFFNINGFSGLISVAGVLDTETLDVVHLVLQAQDRANNGSIKVSSAYIIQNIAKS